MANMKIMANLKKSIQPKAVLKNAIGIGAAVPYIIVATVFGLSGWLGFGVSFATTWLIGALFDIEELKVGAFAIGGAHLAYTIFGEAIEKATGSPVWRMQTGVGVTGLYDSPIMPLQSGSQVTTLPDGYQVQSYPGLPSGGVGDYYPAGGTEPALVGSRSDYEQRM